MKLDELRHYIRKIVNEQHDTIKSAELDTVEDEVIATIKAAFPAAKVQFDPRHGEINVTRIGQAQWGFRISILFDGRARVLCPKFAVDAINAFMTDLGFVQLSTKKMQGVSFWEGGDYEIIYSSRQ